MSEYRGLVNEGATCYLNSLIQTLFMTPQFRRNAYKYVHDSRKIQQADSIPYQLQKLFVKLQQNQSSVYTKGLRRSFQWNDTESFQQHDVQEFCRILFEAIQKVFKGNNWIEKLYAGTVISTISCGKHVRESPQIFMDISLPIRNLVTNQYYKSIEQCLKAYIKPQKLQDVDCQQCNSRVQVEKGMKFSILPPIITFQLNRFQLNYTTFQREKVNSFVYYPQILDMNKFLKPYNEIQIDPIPKDLQANTKLQAKQKSARTTDWGDLSIRGKGIQRKNSDEIQAKKEKVKFLDEQNRDKREQITKQLSKEQQKNKNLQILQDLKADKGKFDKKMDKIQSKQNKVPQPPKQQEDKYNIEDDMLFGNFMADVPKQFTVGSFQKGDAPRFEKTEAVFQHQEEGFDIDKQYPANTYVLYSILVHNGGAYGGHYYAYIFNGENWFRFNDNTVTKVAKSQIRKYGHPSQSSSYGTNAYLLFYRQANSFKEDMLNQSIEIPAQLIEKVEKDKTLDLLKQHNQTTQMNKMDMLNRKVLFKIYWPNNPNTEGMEEKDSQKMMSGNNLAHEVLVIEDRLEETVQGLRNKVKQIMGIYDTIEDENWRIRRYNKMEDSMHEAYGPNIYQKNLDSVGLRETCYIAIQTKNSSEKFQDYDPQNIVVKLNVWRQNLTILTEHYLKPKKIGIRDQRKFSEFYQKVEEIVGFSNPIIIKRNFSSGKIYDKFTLQENKDKTLLSLRFFNGINLYVEKPNQGKLLWQIEFENQKYRCSIKYNNPKLGPQKNQQIHYDTRKTLGDLKTALSQIIGIPFEEFRIKKSAQTVQEMITYKKKLIDLRFINNEIIYIEEGRSSKGSLLIKKAAVDLVDDKIQFTIGEETLIELEANMTNCAEIKNALALKIGIEPFNIRIRQFKAFQFGEIYSDTTNVQRLKDKSLVWEEIQCEDPHGIQIYVRVFDIINMQLGPILTVFIENSANYEQFALILEEQTFIQADQILAWKSSSNYIEKSILFEIQWEQIKFIRKAIRQEPLYLSNDGQILIVKAAEKPYHPKPDKKYLSSSQEPGTVSGNKPKKGEASLKITVIEQKQLEPQEQTKVEIISQNKDEQQIVNISQEKKVEDQKI